MKFFVAGHALIERKGKYLITRRSKSNTYMPLKWDVPGGIVKAGETMEEAISLSKRGNWINNRDSSCYPYICKPRPIAKAANFPIIYLCKYIAGEVILIPQNMILTNGSATTKSGKKI